ncbi:MAG TPA: branched-chain amino acid ABC transporter permease [Acidiphilium sp.]|uniref:branched-chain amino acid ABC transporter permease n=1 Tax=unclassified Acidiphilium TaxID=2617493 RepID=UPI000BC7C6FC|nr:MULTISPECIES: branched-chain amino acid ABC transporter permease [unclassified Acidiphilium]OYV57738.1 MAG: branched-chain amino acid ABC transporter permease [Acidiphilium sp. 20-67-58]OYV87492.1 MAG: branched-chain amino acid ABC transporter permease [Acidiphilium sp. 21-68-69]HQT60042.1 branched-chain amino acid ABC transporter permease [Acidiphilium sp.]HQU10709.1 branched-chain amino acid ABC transporter permease [Acidiphilium sp.]
MFSEFIQLTIAGLAVGSIYALIALGFVLIYTSVNVVNFAQGDFAMIGAYFMVSLVVVLHLPWWLALLLAVAATGLVGALFQLLIFQPVRNRPRNFLPVMIATVGASVFLEQAFLLIYGPIPYQLPPIFKAESVAVLGVHVYPQYIVIIVVTAAMVALLNWFLERTKLGKQLQATAQDPDTARLMGIRVAWMAALTFAISTALGGLAGLLIAPVYTVTATMGSSIALKAFAAAIVGGFGSMKGAIVGGLGIGLIETYGATYISGSYRDAFPFIVLILFLIFRPYGLFGEKISQKV